MIKPGIKPRKNMYSKWVKRILDFIVASIVLILLFPLLLLFAILVRIKLGSPIFFKQTRPGLHEKCFTIYKFRTMLDNRNEHHYLLPDEQRLTRFGRLLRNLSIDELPELVNVIKGQMSLVGPRPLLPEYLPYYSPEQRLRHNVRPGITGWAQINGRNRLSWDNKFELDNWYVKHCSFFLDSKIIFYTLFKIIKREGINAEGHATMTRLDLEFENKNSLTKSKEIQ